MKQQDEPLATGRMSRIPFVLMYHSVDQRGDDPYLITVSPQRFSQQMRTLQRWGLRGVSMAQLWRAQAAGQADRLVGLTFDDGYADFARHVVPELTRVGFTATLFVVAGRMGAANDWDDGVPKPLLSQRQVRQVAEAGFEIGSHGWRHARLPQVSGAELDTEVRRSREVLQEVTGAPITGFCYPYGDRDDTVTRAVRRAGYDYACATRASGEADRHAIPRTYVGERDGMARLWGKRLRHRLTWRAGT